MQQRLRSHAWTMICASCCDRQQCSEYACGSHLLSDTCHVCSCWCQLHLQQLAGCLQHMAKHASLTLQLSIVAKIPSCTSACSSVRTLIKNMSPEVLGTFSNNHENKACPKIDVWGAGCVLYQLLAKRPMWGAESAWDQQPLEGNTSTANRTATDNEGPCSTDRIPADAHVSMVKGQQDRWVRT